MNSDDLKLSPGATRAVQAAYDVFREQGDWPSYQYVDHQLDRDEYDAAEALRDMPAALAYFDKSSPRLATITLTVGGVAVAAGSEADQALFMRLLRWCVAQENAFEPQSPTGPHEELRVTSEDFDRESEGSVLTEVDQHKALSFLRTENLATGSGGPGAPPEIWSASLDQHRIRGYRNTQTIDAYLEQRIAEVSPSPFAALAPTMHVPAPPAWPQSTGLSRGRRVTIIKQSARRLSDMSHVDRDLTLRGFDVSGDSEPNEDGYEYSTRLLSGAGDDTLLEISTHLAESDLDVAPAADDEEGPWEPDHFRLFLSHTHNSAAALAELKASLEPLGIDAFIAHMDIAPAEQWETVIETALRTCDALAAFLTEDFPASHWTDQEVGWVAGRRRLIVAIDESCTPYGFIGKWQSMKASRPDLLDALVGVLAAHERTARRMAEVQVGRFERTSSAGKGQQRIQLLERIGLSGWTEELLDRVERAVVDNAVLASTMIGTQSLAEIAHQLVDAQRTKDS